MNLFRVKTKTLCAVIVTIVAFLVSFDLSQNFINGDQYFYHLYYERLYNQSIFDVYKITRESVSSGEPLSGLIYWIGSNLSIAKNIYFSVINSFLFTGLLILLIKYQAQWFVIILMQTNFYMFVLAFSAERLKLSYLVIIYAMIFLGKTQKILLVSVPFFHVQSMILYASILMRNVHDVLKNIMLNAKIKKKDFIYLSIILPIMLISAYFFFAEYISTKLPIYLGFWLNGLWKFPILAGIGIFTSKDKSKMASGLFILLIPTLLLGASRINIITFTYIFYTLMLERRLSHPIFVSLLIYFSVQSINFVSNIYLHGDGFGPLSKSILTEAGLR